VPGSRGLKVLPLIGDCLAARAYAQIQRNPLHGALPKRTTSAYHTLFIKHLFSDQRKGNLQPLIWLQISEPAPQGFSEQPSLRVAELPSALAEAEWAERDGNVRRRRRLDRHELQGDP
jgi:hypothetical protein